MSYDFKPRNKELGKFHLGAFSWPWLMNAGPGLVIGCGQCVTGGYVYETDKRGYAPMDNDGYYIGSKDAKLIARLTRTMVKIERFNRKMWNDLGEADRQIWKDVGRGVVREDFLDKAEKFADWADKSSGFWIH